MRPTWINVYKIDELSEDAKKKAYKDWLLKQPGPEEMGSDPTVDATVKVINDITSELMEDPFKNEEDIVRKLRLEYKRDGLFGLPDNNLVNDTLDKYLDDVYGDIKLDALIEILSKNLEHYLADRVHKETSMEAFMEESRKYDREYTIHGQVLIM